MERETENSNSTALICYQATKELIGVSKKKTIKVEEPLKTAQLDAKLKYKVAQISGGESIRRCFQCGKCTATCPIRRFEDAYKPNQIVRAVLLGLREKVLSSDVIWLCAVCYSCTERCPQGVRLTDVMQAIRNLAVKEGYIHPFFKLQGSAIVDFGRIFEAEEEELINEVRAEMGLPPLSPVDLKEVSKILKAVKEKEKNGK